MRNLILLILIFTLTVQCKNNSQTNSEETQEKVGENKVVGELIGEKLVSVQETEKELGLTFEFEAIGTYFLDLDNDSVEEKIIIEKIRNWNDPGDFHRIRIISQTGEYDFFNGHGWVSIGDYELQSAKSLNDENLIKSNYAIITDVSEADKFLLCFGYAYASEPGLLSVVNLSNQHEPNLVYNDNSYLFGLKDLDKDYTKELLVTWYDQEEIVGKDKPFSAYQLKNGWLYEVE